MASNLAKVEQLRAELLKLDEQLKQAESQAETEKKVISDLEKLLKTHNIDAEKLVELMQVQYPQLKVGEKRRTSSGGNRRQRAPNREFTLSNPETGESIIYKGGRNRIVEDWKEKHGESVVKKWIADAKAEDAKEHHDEQDDDG